MACSDIVIPRLKPWGALTAAPCRRDRIPVYALTELGKALILSKCIHAREPLLVKTERLPFEGGTRPSPLC